MTAEESLFDDGMQVDESGTTTATQVPHDEHHLSSLIIPISSSATSKDLFIEIFPEEIADVSSSTLLPILKDEDAALDVWADAALLYLQQKQSRESSIILQAACDRPSGNREERVRILASAGIAYLTQAAQLSTSGSAPGASKRPGAVADPRDELRGLADNRFTNASKVDTLFPMTWMGRGMLNLSVGRLDQARFFFDTTLKQCGPVLPALLGMAAVLYGDKDFKGAQDMYAKAIRLFPEKSGAPTRVGFGLACYQLGQVDRAKAAFARALDMDPENVEAMVGASILDMASLDPSSKDFNSRTEKAVKMMSMANLLDHSNAMVQNHLANHYFWKWTPVGGSVQMTHGSTLVQGTQVLDILPGERIRIGTEFETLVSEETEDEEDNTRVRIRDAWKGPSKSNVKVWKKDYDRVIALAKGAYNSTSVQDIQAESLYLLARVYHVRDDIENAHKFYEKACKLAPNFSPARFGLAQTLIAQDQNEQAAAHLRLVLGTSSTATDALATLGLLEVKSGKKLDEGLSYIRKAIDLDPLNPDMVVYEALSLQQVETNYPKSLDRYKKAVDLMQRSGKKVPHDLFANIGVLCQETKKLDEGLDSYRLALLALDDQSTNNADLENVGKEGGLIRHPDNSIFFDFVDSKLKVFAPKEGLSTVLKVAEGILHLSTIRIGDHVRLSDTFETEVVEIVDNGESIGLKDAFPAPSEDLDHPITIFVKRENRRLDNPSAISIAFNMARLHEVAGRILPSIELHKAIVRRNPAYVNSYLRLACIARDCGSLKECSEWLKIAAAVAPGNAEVHTLIGNLHLSLCDWAPAQRVFDDLLAKKVPSVESYAMLSVGTIYFSNLKVSPQRYAKHLQYASDFYRRILVKDSANAYAANGLGTILAEQGNLFKAKEVFNRVREATGDAIADAHLNLGHIFLAQRKHPEALQMYQSYMKRTEDGTAPSTSKSRVDDVVDVLLYIAFTYFDWARQTELYNNVNAAPADERYKKCLEYLEAALAKETKKDVILKYNMCMTKLQFANCVLQKLTRNIRRTAKEVEEALLGLEESHRIVEDILKAKTEGQKVLIQTSILQDFLNHCKANIEAARSHLEEERKREEEANEMRELQRLAAETQKREEELKNQLRRQEEARLQEERDRKAEAKMRKVEELKVGWQHEQEAKSAAATKKARGGKDAPNVEEDAAAALSEDDDDKPGQGATTLFDDDSDDDGNDAPVNRESARKSSVVEESKYPEVAEGTTAKDLFGDSSEDESDEELVPSGAKRGGEESSADHQPLKKRRVVDDE